jgi:hypothetical protein
LVRERRIKRARVLSGEAFPFADGCRQGHFFRFAFFTPGFLALFFALLLAVALEERPRFPSPAVCSALERQAAPSAGGISNG